MPLSPCALVVGVASVDAAAANADVKVSVRDSGGADCGCGEERSVPRDERRRRGVGVAGEGVDVGDESEWDDGEWMAAGEMEAEIGIDGGGEARADVGLRDAAE